MLEVKNKHAEIWRLINSVRDWKNAKWGIIKEKSKEDRIKLKIGTGTYSTYWEMNLLQKLLKQIGTLLRYWRDYKLRMETLQKLNWNWSK